MLFPTIDFAIFFVIVLSLYWLLRPYELAWKLFLIGASYYFYSYWETRFVLLLGISAVGNWVIGEAVSRSMRDGQRTHATRVLLALGIAGNLAMLGWFKYYGFFSTEVVAWFDGIGIDFGFPLVEITLPVGISFFTFQAISYVMDISRGTTRPMGFIDFTLLQCFFPHLVAGPLVRASEFGPQLRRPLSINEIDTTAAFTLIFVGLFKKVVISSYLSQEIVDPVFGVPSEHSSWEVLWAIYGYAIQIYADFSGYTDIAIGCALLLGFRFPQNFNAPYTSTSLQDFWRRWHMTLSRWLRDYLYVGLGGNRGSQLFTARNLMLTMVLGGLWHGAAWTFVVWGFIHGGVLVAERYVPGALPAPGTERKLTLANAARWFVIFHVVCIAWVFFRAETFGLAWDMFAQLLSGGGGSPLVTPLIVITILGSLALQFVPAGIWGQFQVGFRRLAPAPQALVLAMGLVLVDALGPEGVAPFIYFQF